MGSDIYLTADGLVYLGRDERIRMVEADVPGSWTLQYEQYDRDTKEWKINPSADLWFTVEIIEGVLRLAKHLESLQAS